MDKGNLHSKQSSKDIEDVIGGDDLVEILLLIWFMSDQSEQNIDRNDVDNEWITSPGCHHVEVSKRWSNWPQDTSRIARLEEYIERKYEGKYSNSLVIIWSCDWSWHVTRNQTNHQCSNKPCSMLSGHFTC